MTKLARLEVENYKRLVAVDLRLNDHVTEISGNNGAGKSSAIDAVAVLLQGLAVAPAVPVRRGAEECVIRGTLGDLIVERKFRVGAEGKTTSTISLRTPEGAKFPSPQKHLDELIGTHMLDPLDFINLDAKKQFDVLRKFVPDVDFEAIDKANKADFERRTEINRFAKEARAAASMVSIPADTPDQPIDESALVAELEKAGDHNRMIEVRKANRETVSRKIDQLDKEVEGIGQRVDALMKEIETLKAEALRKTEEALELQEKLASAEPLPEPIDTAAIRAKIESARTVNLNVNRRAEKTKQEHLAIKYEREAKDLTERMDNRTAQKQNAIAEAKIPVPGIGFGEGVILLNGLPFDQASTAEKLRTAFAIIVALNPKLRLAWIRDASLLDEQSIETVAHLSKEFDVQVLLETVRAVGRNAIVLQDGRVKEEAVQEDAA